MLFDSVMQTLRFPHSIIAFVFVIVRECHVMDMGDLRVDMGDRDMGRKSVRHFLSRASVAVLFFSVSVYLSQLG